MIAADLERIDRALIGLRHLWSGPPQLEDPEFGQVDMSTVWIVNALDQAHRERDICEMSIRDLAMALDVVHSTASRLVDRAVISGAVTRGQSVHDARLAVVALTDRGRALARTSQEFRARYLAQMTRGWSAAERATFADLLTRFTHAVGSTPPADPEGTT